MSQNTRQVKGKAPTQSGLSKHANMVNRVVISLLHFTEMQDVLNFGIKKTLFGFPHLPPFLQCQITAQLATNTSIKFTMQALSDGFKRFINSMVRWYWNSSNHVKASVLLTIPKISEINSFCPLKYLTPIKFESSGVCYAAPVTTEFKTNSHVIKCYQDSSTFICPTTMLTVVTNILWLSFPCNPEAKLSFQGHHMAAQYCFNLHPTIHLGGSSFLATTSTTLPLSTGPLGNSPLHCTCNCEPYSL